MSRELMTETRRVICRVRKFEYFTMVNKQMAQFLLLLTQERSFHENKG